MHACVPFFDLAYENPDNQTSVFVQLLPWSYEVHREGRSKAFSSPRILSIFIYLFNFSLISLYSAITFNKALSLLCIPPWVSTSLIFTGMGWGIQNNFPSSIFVDQECLTAYLLESITTRLKMILTLKIILHQKQEVDSLERRFSPEVQAAMTEADGCIGKSIITGMKL